MNLNPNKSVNFLCSLTGCGVADCRKAYNECDGDLAAAVKYLRCLSFGFPKYVTKDRRGKYCLSLVKNENGSYNKDCFLYRYLQKNNYLN